MKSFQSEHEEKRAKIDCVQLECLELKKEVDDVKNKYDSLKDQNESIFKDK